LLPSLTKTLLRFSRFYISSLKINFWEFNKVQKLLFSGIIKLNPLSAVSIQPSAIGFLSLCTQSPYPDYEKCYLLFFTDLVSTIKVSEAENGNSHCDYLEKFSLTLFSVLLPMLQDTQSIRYYQKLTDDMVDLWHRGSRFDEIRLYVDGYIACLRDSNPIEPYLIHRLEEEVLSFLRDPYNFEYLSPQTQTQTEADYGYY
jgi:hypothetical protein